MSKYIKATGIRYSGTLSKIKKKDKDPLQPIYEAFTNSLEAVKLLKEQHNSSDKGCIKINIFVTKTLIEKKYDFSKIEISDTGIGFNDEEFNRLVDLHDERKGFLNKGTGRIQFVHSFNETKVISVYRDDSSATEFKQRIFTISKSERFLRNNAIIQLEDGDKKEVEDDASRTSLTFKNILLDKDKKIFNNLTVEKLKEHIIKHYLVYFCEHSNNLPEIYIQQTIDKDAGDILKITSADIPEIDKEQNININYSTISNGEIKKTFEKETFNLKAFKISKDTLSENELNLVSKGEIARSIDLENLLSTDQIEGNRYLFFLSGKYIDNKDGDTRGDIKILTEKELKKQGEDLFNTKEILLENIERQTNSIIIELYDEIRKKHLEKLENIDELKKMFLLNQETIDSLKNRISINDTDDTILRKVYEADAKIIAKSDAEMKNKIKDLYELDTTNKENYDNALKEKTNELVKNIPLQNRTALTRYVARRKLVLDLFEVIIKKELKLQKKSKRNIDEKLLHNLIFQQTSDNPENSDLWLVNEDFIYFKGASEEQLGKILLNNVSIIKDNLSSEEDEYRLKQGGDAAQKRPDILLFPDERKCIIIEFKSLDTNASDHLNQINRYASLINNLSKDNHKFTTYYGYLIGENIDVDDIQDNDSDFISAHHLDFIYRPHKRIVGKFGKDDGSLYTEVIKYSTLLKRALIRNKIFIDKITKPSKSPNEN